jgi:cation diffusion facilitator family transporter
VNEQALARYAWLSIGAAVATIALKAVAWLLTRSVGLLSDAIESLVNLVAAVVMLLALRVAARPPDDDHPHGHEKVEYFASGLEGAMVLVAAVAIGIAAVPRLLEPRPLEAVEIGMVVSVAASAVNLVVARVLLAAGKKHRSLVLEADGQHLMTDVWTSAGVLVAVGLVRVTGWNVLDPMVALLVAANILRVGWRLVYRSGMGLLDASLPADELQAIEEVLDRFRRTEQVGFHAVRTRQAGRRRFVSLHVLVPGEWTVQRGHDLCEAIERELRATGPSTSVFTHLEPLEDPRSFDDQGLDR